ncbi:glycosyltransferase family 2 protein [Corynebacterium qintianiae]|uniref:Glycosyltransferase family 2 protein n=1 Tax=Corynebacterium qintianiae TaxID=2709392 RepID=A0A7T0KPY8_9CORY|nr:glycosyltransferase family 2 protein [Corynebacterium qintianiae]QPK84235.1 glycosyltransferase family 2 protein [Corynebacterium qintianiae]
MKPAPPLAVITVTFSPGRHLRALADSLETASAGPTVLVCADNGSTDGAPEALAAKREGVEVFSTGGNIGYGAAINAAVKRLEGRREAGEIDGDFFLITNPDVRFTPGSVDALMACAQREPKVGAAGPRIEEADGSAYPSARAVPGLFTGSGHALLYDVWPDNPFSAAYRSNNDMEVQRTAGWLSGACLLVRWGAFDDIGGFDERYFMYLEDVDFGDRLNRAGWDNLYCPSSVIKHDQGHVAGKHSRVTVPAHHKSAYRFQADRHPAWWQAPLRWALWCGLQIRGMFQLTKGS